jgi:hypothetical protein
MSPLVRKIFLQFMPKLLIMRRTTYTLPEYDDNLPPRGYTNEMELQLNMRDPFNTDFKITTREPSFVLQNPDDDSKMKAHSSMTGSSNMTPRTLSANVISALQGVRFIAQHISDADKDNEVIRFYGNIHSEKMRIVDCGRLEVRLDGPRSLLFMGVHSGVRWRNMWDHISGSVVV